jgi:hypothetical protein
VPVVWELDADIEQALRAEPALIQCPTGRLYVLSAVHDGLIYWTHTSPSSGHLGICQTVLCLGNHTTMWLPYDCVTPVQSIGNLSFLQHLISWYVISPYTDLNVVSQSQTVLPVPSILHQTTRKSWVHGFQSNRELHIPEGPCYSGSLGCPYLYQVRI